jgi:serpin B
VVQFGKKSVTLDLAMPIRSSLLRVRSCAAIVGMAGAIGCADPAPTTPAPSQVATAARTALPRDLTPAERGVLASSNAFSIALWHKITSAQRDSNVFVSPLSASLSVGMALGGAAGQTFDELRAGLQFGAQPLGEIDAGYKSLIALLTSLDPSVTMDVANSIWYRNTFPFNQSFLDDGANYFNAAIKPLDFADVNGSLSSINGWVNTQTKGKIPTILNTITSDDVMFLINAIYFKGSWRSRFDPAKTLDASFHSVSGDQPARLMHRTDKIAYAATSAYQAVDLPYGDSAFTMTVILPDAATNVDTVAASLTGESWQALTSSFHVGQVDLYLPKLTMSWERALIPDMKALGVNVPFTSGADFTRMSPHGRELYISMIKQKTFVDINEEGTEAAAVTVTGIGLVSLPQAQTIRIDRPFLFVIRERLSGTILFMGKVVRLP